MFIYCEKHIPKNVPNFLCGLSLFLLHRRSSFSVLYPLYSRPFLCVFSALLFRPFQPRLSNFILQTAQPVLLELSVFLASCVHCMWLICPQCPCVKSLFLCFCQRKLCFSLLLLCNYVICGHGEPLSLFIYKIKQLSETQQQSKSSYL